MHSKAGDGYSLLDLPACTDRSAVMRVLLKGGERNVIEGTYLYR